MGSRAARPLNWGSLPVITIILVLMAGIALISLGVGAQPISVAEVLSVLIRPDDSLASIILWKLRLPRICIAILAGAALAASGFVLQSVTRNPLASPSLTGVTAGASLFIVACIVLFPSVSPLFYPVIGFAGGAVAALITLALCGRGGISPMRLALAGVTVSFLAAALTTLLMLKSGSQSGTLFFWLSGGLQGRSWNHFWMLMPWVAAGLAGVLLCFRPMILMSLGDDAAQAMGAHVGLWRYLLVGLSVCLAGAVVSVAGPIGFIGLCIPHLARLMVPKNVMHSLILAMVMGACLLLGADLLARSLAPPRELPVGVLTALIGGPVLIFLIYRQAR